MKAMLLKRRKGDLELAELPIPTPSEHQLLLRVSTCGLCRTDLHVVDGDLPEPSLPLIPGHQIVGIIEQIGGKVEGFQLGDRVGVPWLQGSCGHCRYCLSGRENLCDQAVYTGYHVHGGFAEYCVANARFCFPLPSHYSDLNVAPLLCAGFIGYRSLCMTDQAQTVGFYGFGASAHILAQVARYQGRQVYAFTRAGDRAAQELALKLGCVWAGASEDLPPVPLEAAIIFAPVGGLVPLALKAVAKGGIVVCAGIHMSDIPSFPYSLLWEERLVRSVANLTRQDGYEFLEVASHLAIETQVTPYPLEKVNEALNDLRSGNLLGAGVITLS
jgi:propanol-preferring alcohol dehydrogenase